MRISRNALFAVAVVAGTTLLATSGFAANTAGAAGAGSDILTALQGSITGNLGLIIGLALAILGIWTWVVKQETMAGIMLIIGGVLITIAPGVFNTIGNFVGPLVGITGGNLTEAQPGTQVRNN